MNFKIVKSQNISKLILFSFLLTFLLLITSCGNFLNGSSIKSELEDKIQYENAANVVVNVIKLNPDDTNEIEPNGKISDYKVGYPFEINYTSSSTFIFKRWQAVDADQKVFRFYCSSV